MPFQLGKDSKGSYIRWGTRGKKYYTGKTKTSRKHAKQKAVAQALAIQYSQKKAGKRTDINLHEG